MGAWQNAASMGKQAILTTHREVGRDYSLGMLELIDQAFRDGFADLAEGEFEVFVLLDESPARQVRRVRFLGENAIALAGARRLLRDRTAEIHRYAIAWVAKEGVGVGAELAVEGWERGAPEVIRTTRRGPSGKHAAAEGGLKPPMPSSEGSVSLSCRACGRTTLVALRVALLSRPRCAACGARLR